jgi:hypothetical protein
MYDINNPYDDEEQRRALEALGTTGPDDPQAPDDSAAIQALAKESDRTSMPPQGSRVASQSAPENTPVQQGDDSGPGLNGWAVAADLVFNRGRGLGQIISMAEQEKRDYIKAKGAGKDKAAEEALRKRSLDLEGRRLDLVESGQGTRQAANASKAEQSDKDRSAMLARIGEVNPEAADALKDASPQAIRAFMTQLNVDYRHKMAPELNQDAADRAQGVAGASTNSTTNALRDNPRAITAEQDVTNKREQAQMDASLEEKALARETRAKQQKIDNVDKYNRELGDVMSIAENAHKLKNIFNAHPDDLPGVGAWDARKPDFMKSQDDIDAGNIFAQFANPQFKDIAGRAVTGAEQERVLQQVGNLKSTDERTVRSAVDEIEKSMTSRIRGGSVGREDVAREILRQHGLEDLLGAPAATEQPSAATGVGGGGGGDTLPVTNQRARDVPKVSAIIDQDDELKKLGIRRIGQ